MFFGHIWHCLLNFTRKPCAFGCELIEQAGSATHLPLHARRGGIGKAICSLAGCGNLLPRGALGLDVGCFADHAGSITFDVHASPLRIDIQCTGNGIDAFG